jgi:hypothetical protein
MHIPSFLPKGSSLMEKLSLHSVQPVFTSSNPMQRLSSSSVDSSIPHSELQPNKELNNLEQIYDWLQFYPVLNFHHAW